jgi:TldD protein
MTQARPETSGSAERYFQQQYGIDHGLITRLLDEALSRGGEYADVYFEHRLSRDFQFEDQSVKQSSSSIIQGVGIRVVSEESIGYAYSEDLTLEAMAGAARTAAAIASSQRNVGAINLTQQPIPNFYPLEHTSIDAAADAKVDLLRRADAAARAYDPSITKVSAGVGESLRQILIATSEGRVASDTQPTLVLRVHVLSERGNSRQVNHQSRAGHFNLDYFDTRTTPEQLARKAAEVAVRMHEAIEAPAGTLPVVLAAGDSGVYLHEAVGHGLEADFNRKRTSNFSDRIGQKVASDLCTVVDDGTLGHLYGSINVDDEGAPGQRNVLIENGVLRSYMHDWISARHFGVPQSGNGRRETFRHFPMPRMTNTYMTAGQDDPQDIIRSVKRGIYCVSFKGGQVNISNGDFVFSAQEAYLIEDGRVTAPIRDVNLTGNGPDSLSRVTMVGHDWEQAEVGGFCGKNGQRMIVSFGQPTILVNGIVVGGTRLSQ